MSNHITAAAPVPGEWLIQRCDTLRQAATVDTLIERIAQALHDQHCSSLPVSTCRAGDRYIVDAHAVLPELAGWLRDHNRDPAVPDYQRNVLPAVAATIERGTQP